MKEILVNGQWQGRGDLVTFDGAKEITKMYLAGLDYVFLPSIILLRLMHSWRW